MKTRHYVAIRRQSHLYITTGQSQPIKKLEGEGRVVGRVPSKLIKSKDSSDSLHYLQTQIIVRQQLLGCMSAISKNELVPKAQIWHVCMCFLNKLHKAVASTPGCAPCQFMGILQRQFLKKKKMSNLILSKNRTATTPGGRKWKYFPNQHFPVSETALLLGCF